MNILVIEKLNLLMQTNAPLEEVRKNIWLVDSKVCVKPNLAPPVCIYEANSHLPSD